MRVLTFLAQSWDVHLLLEIGLRQYDGDHGIGFLETLTYCPYVPQLTPSNTMSNRLMISFEAVTSVWPDLRFRLRIRGI